MDALLSPLFADGRVALVVLGFMAAELPLLALLRARTGRGPSPGALIPNLLGGAFMLLALAAALRDLHWHWIAAALIGSLVAHLADLALRWRT